MKSILKTAREKKGYKTIELANLLGIDQALVSKFESGSRFPTRNQVAKLSEVLEIDYDILMVSWIKEKIHYEFGDDTNVLQALAEILSDKNYAVTTASNEPKIDSILEEMERLKDRLQQLR